MLQELVRAGDGRMSELSRDDVLAVVRPIDDATIAEIIATGVSRGERKQAAAFFGREVSVRESPLGEGGSTLE